MVCLYSVSVCFVGTVKVGISNTPNTYTSLYCFQVSSLPEDVLFKQVCTYVSSIQISDFTSRPYLLQTEDSCTRDVGILLGLDHDDKTGVYRN